MKKIESNMAEALGDSTAKEYIQGQLESIRLSAHEAEKLSFGAFQRMLLLAAAFELFRRAAVSEVSLFGFKFTDVALILKILPALIAFLFYRFVTQAIRRNALLEAYGTALKILQPSVYRFNLAVLAFPP